MDQQKIKASLAARALPTLPYAADALAPVISSQTIDFHYNKHHKTYVEKLNQLITGTVFENLTVQDIMLKTYGDANAISIFNNAAQTWNHTFYWYSLKPNGGGKPVGPIKDKIEATFGSIDNLKKEWANLALNTFGSGWAWLVLDGDELKIIKTENANSPIVHSLQPLLTIDVWEHAYYLDYQNRRADYVNALLDQLINWDFATHNYLQATTTAIA